MTVTSTTTPVSTYTATDAGFRIWGKAWCDAMESIGCTQVYSDIDWATVARPAAAATYAGKRVYTINDSLSSNRQIYIKLEFGRGSSGGVCGLALRVVVGTIHTSGTVTGYPMEHYIATSDVSTDPGELIATRTDTGIALFGNLPFSASQYMPGFAVERVAKNAAATPDGVVALWFATNVDSTSASTGIARIQAASYTAPTVYTDNPINRPAPAATDLNVDQTENGRAPLYPIWTYGLYDPLRTVILVGLPYSSNQLLTASLNGAEGTYRTLPGIGPKIGSYGNLAFRVA